MTTKSTLENWGWVTRALHWSIALTVFGMLAAGLYASSVDQSTPAGELRYFSVIDVHKSFGLTVLMLMAFRVIWRAGERTPNWAGLIHLKGAEATTAHHIHIITAFVLMTIVALHVMGALKNHFINHNNVLRKMLGLAPYPIEVPPRSHA